MKRRQTALLILLIVQHGLFVTFTVWRAPTDAALLLPWTILPAFTAAIGCRAARGQLISAVANGIFAAIVFNYLFLVHGYYPPHRPDIAPIFAVSYQLLALVISGGCGAFVHVITTAIEKHVVTTMKQRLTIAAKKGLTFSSVCVVATLPVLLLLLPPHASPHRLTVSLAYSLGVIAGGILVASVVGALYSVAESPQNPVRLNSA